MSQAAQPINWLTTKEMAADLRISVATLERMRASGVFELGVHYRFSNIRCKHSKRLWNAERCRIATGAV